MSEKERLVIERLRARQPELEQEALARIDGILDPAATFNPSYPVALRAALAAALDYGLAAVARPNREPGPVPVALHAQARLAARDEIGLERSLRPYSVSHTLLADSLLDEAAAAGIAVADLRPSLRSLAGHYECMVATVGEEYGREAHTAARHPEARRAEVLRRLLAGELLDTSGLNYDLEGQHVAMLASGAFVRDALLELAECLDRCLLVAEPAQGITWAWLGGRREFNRDDLGFLTSHRWGKSTKVACGEPAAGPAGWRLSHRQAAAALPVTHRLPETLVHYPDVALLTAAHSDDLLGSFLRRRYLTPLESERDGGKVAKRTLRAYFVASGNVSSTAAALGVNRATVRARLDAIEKRLGCPLTAAQGDLEVALRLDAIEPGQPTPQGVVPPRK